METTQPTISTLRQKQIAKKKKKEKKKVPTFSKSKEIKHGNFFDI